MSEEELFKSGNSGFPENSLNVLSRRYLRRDKSGRCIETPEQLFRRVSDAIAEAEYSYGKTVEDIKALSDKFYDMMINRYFMPNSPALMNAGSKLGQLAACFVLPIDDSLEDIFETLKNTALIHKSGGGTGFSFSRLRPKNSLVCSTMGVSSGPVSFMEVFNAATEAIKQGGTRRGANMGILRVDHPDIVEFINCKSENNKLNNFNISIAITDKFMNAAINGTDYELINPQDGSISGIRNAREIFNLIIDAAWRNGEPGVIFLDRINENNPTPKLGEIESTNPCGEVPLLPYEACNLGSINLGLMIKQTSTGAEVDWEKLARTVRLAIRFLDNVIDVNKYPLPQISEIVKGNRKIGLGVMGLADMLMKLSIPYNSEEGVEKAAEVMEYIEYISKKESVELAKSRGRFKNFRGSIYDNKDYFKKNFGGKIKGRVSEEDWAELDRSVFENGLRNATTTCIAPTGTISIIAGASGGIEPLFGLVFIRNIMDGTQMLEVNPVFKEYLEQNDLYSEEVIREIAESGTISSVEGIPQPVKRIYVTAHEVTPYWHVKMQSAFQRYTDNAVSKTVNFVETATREEIKETYELAYRSGLKGITVYRNNSRQFQPMISRVKQGKVEISELKDKKTLTCPECGNNINIAEGCFVCPVCGYTGCT